MVVVMMSPSGTGFDIYNFQGSTDVVIDIDGYYGAPVPAPMSQTLRALATRR